MSSRPLALVMFDWILESRAYVPHGHCYLWQPTVLWLNVVADACIAGAYFSIPVVIGRYLARRWGELQNRWVPLLFAAFIFLCGITHVMEIYTVWHPVYRLSGVLKALTAVASVSTAVALVFVMPRALKLQTPRQLQDEVAQRTKELASANARLNRFLATLAHELRNPLAPIVNGVVLLEQETLSAAALRARDVIGRQVQHLARLVDDLIELGRIANDRIVLRCASTPLREVIAQSLEAAQPVIEAHRHHVTLVGVDDAPSLTIDAIRLTQVFTNLLVNAALFQAPGGRIELRVHTGEDGVRVAVSDPGIGIAPEHLAVIFEPFSRVAGAVSSSGLGLGLALSRQLVALHGGTLVAHSAGVGQGATFEVRLPLTPPRPFGAPASASFARLAPS